MSWNRVITTAAAVALGLGLSASADAGMKVAGDDNKNLKIGALLQAWAVFNEGSPEGTYAPEFYLRRMRLMVYGQLSPKVNFFVETDNPNFGKGGDWSGNTFIQDAYVEFNLHEAFQVDVGMVLVPFSHNSFQSAASHISLDYQSALIRYPHGAHKVWRDAGLIFRGLLLDKRIDYRVGIYDGVHGDAGAVARGDETFAWTEQADPRNPSDLPRVSARVTVNVFEAEGGGGVGGVFVDGMYLKKTDAGLKTTKKVLAIAGAVDMQPGLNVVWDDVPTTAGAAREIAERGAYMAACGDVFWSIPIGDEAHQSLNGLVAGYYYNYGDRSDGNTWYDTAGVGQYSGVGVSAVAGYRINYVQPVVLVDWFESQGAGADDALGDYLSINGGLNYYMLGNATTLKLQVGATQVNGGDWAPAAIVQTQLVI